LIESRRREIANRAIYKSIAQQSAYSPKIYSYGQSVYNFFFLLARNYPRFPREQCDGGGSRAKHTYGIWSRLADLISCFLFASASTAAAGCEVFAINFPYTIDIYRIPYKIWLEGHMRSWSGRQRRKERGALIRAKRPPVYITRKKRKDGKKIREQNWCITTLPSQYFQTSLSLGDNFF